MFTNLVVTVLHWSLGLALAAGKWAAARLVAFALAEGNSLKLEVLAQLKQALAAAELRMAAYLAQVEADIRAASLVHQAEAEASHSAFLAKESAKVKG